MRPHRQRPALRWIASVAIVSAIGLTGCSQAMRTSMPDTKGRLAITVSSERPSKAHDMPPGIHQVPETSVYIAGYQGETMKVGSYFGLIGMLAADAAASSTSEQKTSAVQAQLRLDLAAATQRLLAEELPRADAARFVSVAAPGDSSLAIIPYLVVSSTGDDQVRPWVFLKTVLTEAGGGEKWKTRYIVSLGPPRPLAGPNGWASGDGTALRVAVDEGLRTAISLMLRDAAGGLPRDGSRAVKVKTQWAWVKDPLELDADVLAETPQTITVLPKVADISVFAGVNVLDKSSVSVTADQK